MGQVRQDPGCSKHVTKLSETFLPIVVNTIATYTACCDIGVTNAEEMARLNESVINGLKYTTRACYTIINNINEDDMVSATLDVSVMKQPMEQEGILPEDIID